MCYEFQFYGNSRVVCSELQKPAGSQNPSATAGSQDLAGTAQEPAKGRATSGTGAWLCAAAVGAPLCVSWVDAAMSCSFPVPKLGSAGVVGVLEQLEGNGTACKGLIHALPGNQGYVCFSSRQKQLVPALQRSLEG